jgi:hydrogenase maturation protease
VAARIVGLGQEWAGDDGVGLAVVRHLRNVLPPAIELVEATDPTQLITLLTDGGDPVVIIDAVLDEGPAGRVLLIDAQSDPSSTHLLSTHGLGVMEAIELALTAHPTEVARKIFIVGITINSASRGSTGLSLPVAGAVPIAAAQALKLADN